ncbi:transcriptional regulator [Enterococcus sp. JM4C]|uniref:YlbF family regulator n=1 Tax=Candidatus Enterococcus huntleyi TaxID=1857217 RepID=UPI00137B539C|nr:YlbF family regulator [Enterococcus sp. JM4C]KAF1296888.1 transcriptional regulator [Enterococcus sp. JM4C]
MIINEQLFALEDQCEEIVAQLLQSQTCKNFFEAKQALATSQEAMRLQKDFLKNKEAFERIADYGLHAPGYRETQRALRKSKRELDINEQVAAYRVAETQLQDILDSIGLTVANTVSEEIKVDAGNPFFLTGGHSGCGGSCHAS